MQTMERRAGGGIAEQKATLLSMKLQLQLRVSGRHGHEWAAHGLHRRRPTTNKSSLRWLPMDDTDADDDAVRLLALENQSLRSCLQRQTRELNELRMRLRLLDSSSQEAVQAGRSPSSSPHRRSLLGTLEVPVSATGSRESLVFGNGTPGVTLEEEDDSQRSVGGISGSLGQEDLTLQRMCIVMEKLLDDARSALGSDFHDDIDAETAADMQVLKVNEYPSLERASSARWPKGAAVTSVASGVSQNHLGEKRRPASFSTPYAYMHAERNFSQDNKSFDAESTVKTEAITDSEADKIKRNDSILIRELFIEHLRDPSSATIRNIDDLLQFELSFLGSTKATEYDDRNEVSKDSTKKDSSHWHGHRQISDSSAHPFSVDAGMFDGEVPLASHSSHPTNSEAAERVLVASESATLERKRSKETESTTTTLTVMAAAATTVTSERNLVDIDEVRVLFKRLVALMSSTNNLIHSKRTTKIASATAAVAPLPRLRSQSPGNILSRNSSISKNSSHWSVLHGHTALVSPVSGSFASAVHSPMTPNNQTLTVNAHATTSNVAANLSAANFATAAPSTMAGLALALQLEPRMMTPAAAANGTGSALRQKITIPTASPMTYTATASKPTTPTAGMEPTTANLGEDSKPARISVRKNTVSGSIPVGIGGILGDALSQSSNGIHHTQQKPSFSTMAASATLISRTSNPSIGSTIGTEKTGSGNMNGKESEMKMHSISQHLRQISDSDSNLNSDFPETAAAMQENNNEDPGHLIQRLAHLLKVDLPQDELASIFDASKHIHELDEDEPQQRDRGRSFHRRTSRANTIGPSISTSSPSASLSMPVLSTTYATPTSDAPVTPSVLSSFSSTFLPAGIVSRTLSFFPSH